MLNNKNSGFAGGALFYPPSDVERPISIIKSMRSLNNQAQKSPALMQGLCF
jgi:hypothetical protein